MKLKNDKERIAFLEDYRNLDHGWYPWKEDGDLQRRMWRLDLPGCAIIVEEQLQTFEWPRKHETWNVKHWYVVSDWKRPFANNTASRFLALAALKKELKNET